MTLSSDFDSTKGITPPQNQNISKKSPSIPKPVDNNEISEDEFIIAEGSTETEQAHQAQRVESKTSTSPIESLASTLVGLIGRHFDRQSRTGRADASTIQNAKGKVLGDLSNRTGVDFVRLAEDHENPPGQGGSITTA